MIIECNVFQKYLKTPLMMASESGSERVARAILEAGGKVDMLDYRQNHAAHFAAKGGFLGVLAVMTGYNANFDQVNMDGNTPIHFGAMAGHGVCCKFLSQRGKLRINLKMFSALMEKSNLT